MCRNIRTLRPPHTASVTEEEVRAAALQYVRKVSGFREPSARNREAFDRAVEQVAAATAELLESLVVRAARGRAHEPDRHGEHGEHGGRGQSTPKATHQSR